jgi:hypothetical protein
MDSNITVDLPGYLHYRAVNSEWCARTRVYCICRSCSNELSKAINNHQHSIWVIVHCLWMFIAVHMIWVSVIVHRCSYRSVWVWLFIAIHVMWVSVIVHRCSYRVYDVCMIVHSCWDDVFVVAVKRGMIRERPKHPPAFSASNAH